MTAKTPPKTLSKESVALWKGIIRDCNLEDSVLVILKTALEQYDVYIRARDTIEKEGITSPTREGVKTHPAVGVMKTARDGFLAAWKLLGIGVDIKDVGRPTDDRELEWSKKLGLVKT